jgi:hypothetical protein
MARTKLRSSRGGKMRNFVAAHATLGQQLALGNITVPALDRRYGLPSAHAQDFGLTITDAHS